MLSIRPLALVSHSLTLALTSSALPSLSQGSSALTTAKQVDTITPPSTLNELNRGDQSLLSDLLDSVAVLDEGLSDPTTINVRRKLAVDLGKTIEKVLRQRPAEAIRNDEMLAPKLARAASVSERVLNSIVEQNLAGLNERLETAELADVRRFLSELNLQDHTDAVRAKLLNGDLAGVEALIETIAPGQGAKYAAAMTLSLDFTREVISTDFRVEAPQIAEIRALLITLGVANSSLLNRALTRVGAVPSLEETKYVALAITGSPETWTILNTAWRRGNDKVAGGEVATGYTILTSIANAVVLASQGNVAMLAKLQSAIDKFPSTASENEQALLLGFYRPLCAARARLVTLLYRENPELALAELQRVKSSLNIPSGDKRMFDYNIFRRNLSIIGLQSITEPVLCRDLLPSLIERLNLETHEGTVASLCILLSLYPPLLEPGKMRPVMAQSLEDAIRAKAKNPALVNYLCGVIEAYGSSAKGLQDLISDNLYIAPRAITALAHVDAAACSAKLAELSTADAEKFVLPDALKERAQKLLDVAKQQRERIEKINDTLTPEELERLRGTSYIEGVYARNFGFAHAQHVTRRHLAILEMLQSEDAHVVARALQGLGNLRSDRSIAVPQNGDLSFTSAVIDVMHAPRSAHDTHTAVRIAGIDALLRIRSLAGQEYLRKMLQEIDGETDPTLAEHLRANAARISNVPVSLYDVLAEIEE